MLTNEEWRLIDVIGQSPKIIYKDGGIRSTLPLWTLWPTLNEKGKTNAYETNPLAIGGIMSYGLPLFDVSPTGNEVQLDSKINLPFFTSQEDCLKYTLMLSMLAENCGGVAMTQQDLDYTKTGVNDLVLEDGTMTSIRDFDKRGEYSELKMYNYERLWDSEQARFTLKGLEPAYTPTAIPVLPNILDGLDEDDEIIDIYDTYRKVSKEALKMRATLNALIERGKSKRFYQLCDDLLQPFMDEEK
jgi:hypothetical protein